MSASFTRTIALIVPVMFLSPEAQAQDCYRWTHHESCCEAKKPGWLPYPSISCGIECCPWVWEDDDDFGEITAPHSSGWSESPLPLDPVVCEYHTVVCVLVVTWQCLSTQDTDTVQCFNWPEPEGEQDCGP